MLKKFAATCTIGVFLMAAVFNTQVLAAQKNDKAEVDDSDSANGYVSVRIVKDTSKVLKVRVSKDGRDYSYFLSNDKKFNKYPLQMGNGKYSIKVLENVEGTKYSVLMTDDINVTLKDQFAPFKTSHVLVNYDNAPNTVAAAKNLTAASKTTLDQIEAVGTYIINNVVYDTDLANKISSGAITSYVPNVDAIYKTNKGICFDYSSLFASMLRSKGIPTRLVMGYVAPNNVYHAWNEVYIPDVGWVTLSGQIYFDGKNWSRMDTTFAAGNSDISKFVGDGKNYQVTDIY